MNRDDIQKLLGGYATGTLTPEEQQALFEAALDDQDLFDALAREQSLCDLLRDPASKAHLLAALDQQPLRWHQRLTQGWRPLAAVAAMAGVGAIAVAVWQGVRPAKPVLIAKVSPPPVVKTLPPAETAPGAPSANTQAAPPSEAAPTPAQPSPAGAYQALPRAAPGKPAAPTPRPEDANAPAGPLAKEIQAKAPAGPQGVREEDRRTYNQMAQAPKSKDVARSDVDTPSASKGDPAPLPAALPLPQRTRVSGFREGALPGPAKRDVSGAPGTESPEDKVVAPMLRSGSGNLQAGAVGGVTRGAPGVVPPPPPPSKADVRPSQPVQSQAVPPQTAPSQSPQGQQGQQGAQQSQSPSVQLGQALSGRSQSDQVAPATKQGVYAQTVQAETAGSLVDSLSVQDVRSRFYGSNAVSNSPGTPGAPGGAGGSSTAARKKAAAESEKAQAGRQAMGVSALTANSRAAQARAIDLGVRYNLLRQTSTGGFEQVGPNAVKVGDTLELQLMPNDSGTLRVTARRGDGVWREVMAQSVQALQTYITPPMRSGEQELQVTLTRLPTMLTGALLRDGKPTADVSQQSTTEPATYVVSGPASRQLQFIIFLNYQ